MATQHLTSNDLMIGDWVRNKEGKNEQVTSLYDGYICTETHEDSHDYHFTPIPLTKEILIRNGWCEEDFENTLCGGYFPEDEKFRLELDVNEKLCIELGVDGSEVWWTINSVEYYIIPLHYVHELQHALKLCGIDKEISL